MLNDYYGHKGLLAVLRKFLVLYKENALPICSGSAAAPGEGLLIRIREFAGVGQSLWKIPIFISISLTWVSFPPCCHSCPVKPLLTSSFMLKINLAANALARQHFSEDCASAKKAITVLQLRNELLLLRLDKLRKQNQSLIDRVKAHLNCRK